jgi:uncharacterized CHY-type Zn-finger protein
MKRMEMVETEVVYCDFCKEKITDNSYTNINDGNLDFHDWNKNCLILYRQEQLLKQ